MKGREVREEELSGEGNETHQAKLLKGTLAGTGVVEGGTAMGGGDGLAEGE